MPYLERPGAEIYYDVVGEGPPVVFAHGLGGTPVSWWQQVPELAARWKCVVFAARGFHPSRLSRPLPADPSVVTEFVEDMSALIEHLELDRVRLVAQSLGGWTCLEYALAHPDRVAALVLSDTTGTVKPAVDTDPADSERLFRQGIHPACGDRMFHEQPGLHWLYRSLDELSSGVDKRAMVGALAAARTRTVDEVAGLEVPVLGIAGAEDVVIAAGAVRALVESLPNGRYEEVSGAGHSVYFERAAVFNRLVGDFLAAAG
jgi:3-oxoadipate enol-lactonase